MATRRKDNEGRPATASKKTSAIRDLDHDLVEHVRSGRTLQSITLRLGVEQIEEARRAAATSGTPYQVVLRQWIALGAAAAQRERQGRVRRGARNGARVKG